MRRKVIISMWLALTVAVFGLLAQQGEPGAAKGKGGKGGAKAARSPLFFKEEWKETPGGEHPAAQEMVANSNLELKIYGPTEKGKELLVTGSAADETNPVHLWTGVCAAGCGATLRDKNNYADLTGLSRIRWTHKMSGFHQIRPMIKLADGSMLVGDKADGTPTDWTTTEIAIPDVRWRKVDVARMVTTGDWVANPDLSKVDEIGFADLTPGSGHGQGGWSDVASIEVYAKSAKR